MMVEEGEDQITMDTIIAKGANPNFCQNLKTEFRMPIDDIFGYSMTVQVTIDNTSWFYVMIDIIRIINNRLFICMYCVEASNMCL